jgi:hypothetical protein
MAFFLATVTPLLRGQDQPASAVAPGPIASDRPAITNSSVVVPAGSFQMENGFLETNSQGESIVDGPESLVRFGVATRTELRFTVPDYFYNLNTTGSPGSGFGDFAVGVKEQLGPTLRGFDVSAILFLSFPTGARCVSSGGYDAVLKKCLTGPTLLEMPGERKGQLAYCGARSTESKRSPSCWAVNSLPSRLATSFPCRSKITVWRACVMRPSSCQKFMPNS